MLLLTNKPLADWLARPYERQYPPLSEAPPAHILVLGCNHAEASFLPISSQPETCSLNRLVEAAQLWHRNKAAIVHLSGTILQRNIPHTEVGKSFLLALGVPEQHIVLHNGAYNTQEELAAYAGILQQQQAALVTTAMHMPRAMFWAQHYQLSLVAAPTQFLVRQDTLPTEVSAWLPRLSALETYHYLFYEYAGLLQSRVGQLYD
jgi:uncharacterized SAM-binding protein YcdF (DUF218 family)